MNKRNHRTMLISLGIASIVIGFSIALFFALKQNVQVSEIDRLIATQNDFPDKRVLSDTVHKIGHDIGESAGDASLDSLLRKCGDPDFVKGGCLHGVVMGLEHTTTIDQLAGKCTDKNLSDWRFNVNCAHAIGHLLFRNPDNIASYLDACTRFYNNDLIYACGSGVFMEYMLGTHSLVMGSTQQTLRIPDCNTTENWRALVCAGSIGTYTQYYPQDSLEQTATLCQSLQSKDQQKYCILAARDRLELAPQEKQNNFCRLVACNP